MGWYVHIHVCFACDRNDGVAELAKEHLEKLRKYDGDRETQWFLESLSTRTGSNPGPKGGLSLWGIVGNYTDPNVFVNTLKPFWYDLLTHDIDGGPDPSAHILVFYQEEQGEAAGAWEIWLDDQRLITKKHEFLSFTFM